MRSGAGPGAHTEAGAKEGSDRHARGCEYSGEGCQGQEAVWVECQPGRAGPSGGLVGLRPDTLGRHKTTQVGID